MRPYVHSRSRWYAHGLAAAALALCAGPAGAVTVNFDDRPGRGGPFTGSCGASFEIDDEYLDLKVRFASNDPVVCVLEPGNAPSPPNVVTGVTAGNIDFNAPVIASFFDGTEPVAVGSVSLVLTASTSSGTTVEVFDVDGALLATSGSTGPGTHSFYIPKRIHSVRVDNGAFAADDLVFSLPAPPVAVPAASGVGRALLALLLLAVARRGLARARR